MKKRITSNARRLIKPCAMLLLAVASPAIAAEITWLPARNIVSETDVSTNGVLVTAVAASGNATTVNGVTFSNQVNSITSWSKKVSPTVAANLGANYTKLLSTALCDPQPQGSIAITLSGLTPGQSYEVQVWANDNLSRRGPQTITTPNPLDSGALLMQTQASIAGQYTLGTFTADSTTQTILVADQGNSNKQYGAVVQAYQLRQITNPLAHVTWDAWQAIKGNTDIDQTGTLVIAYHFNKASSTSAMTLPPGNNGVTFQPFGARAVDGLTGFNNTSSSGWGSTQGAFANLTPDYQNLLAGAADGGSVGDLVFGGLTPGQWYEVQLWVNESRLASARLHERVNDSPVLNFNPGGPSDNPRYEGGLGQTIIGRFQATAAQQRFNFSDANSHIALNAVQLRSIDAIDPLVVEWKMRRQDLINKLINGRFNPRSPSGNVQLEFAAGMLNQAKQDASDWAQQWGNANQGDGFTFEGWPLVDMLVRWKPYLDQATRNNIANRLPHFNYTSQGTSNLQMLAATMRFLAAQEYGLGVFQYNTTNPSLKGDEDMAGWLTDTCDAWFNGGPGEFASSDYAWLNITPLLSIAQLTVTDTPAKQALRDAAEAAYLNCLAQVAAVWQYNGGYLGVWSPRNYEKDANSQGDFGRFLSLNYGINRDCSYDDAQSGNVPATMLAAMNYTPPVALLHAARDRVAPYESKLRTGTGFQTAYVSGEYILFSLDQAVCAGFGNAYGYGVRWDGASDFFNVKRPAGDTTNNGEAAYTTGLMGYTFGTVQYKDSLLFSFLIDNEHDHHDGLVKFPYALAHVPGNYAAYINNGATSGRLFLHYGKVMVCLSSSVPFNWTPVASSSEIRISTLPTSPSTITSQVSSSFAVAIETASPSEYPGAAAPADQLAAFANDIMAKTSITATYGTRMSPLNGQPTVNNMTQAQYVNRHSDTLYKESPKAWKRQNLAFINGQGVDYTNFPLTQNPWISQITVDTKNNIPGDLVIQGGGWKTVVDANSYKISTTPLPSSSNRAR